MADTHDGLWRSVATEGGLRSAAPVSIVDRLLAHPEAVVVSVQYVMPRDIWLVQVVRRDDTGRQFTALTVDDAAAAALAELDRLGGDA